MEGSRAIQRRLNQSRNRETVIMVESLKLLTRDEGSRICRENCPYAALLFISCSGEISNSKLNRFLDRYTLVDVPDNRLADNIVKTLLRSGDIYEVRGGSYSALPSYAIQRSKEEWVILGDARVDHILQKEAQIFEITSNATTDEVTLERLLLASHEEAERLFTATKTRAFQSTELVELVPDTESLSVPKVWPNYLPTSYPRWQRLNKRGSWVPMETNDTVIQGLCRGLVLDGEDRIISAKYFFRHEDGWSPVTYEEASLWAFKSAAVAGKPYTARYVESKQTLTVPVGLPYTAYVVLKYLGHKRVVRGDSCVIEGIDYNVAETICQKLDITLVKEVA
jgi:hypothetical protein